MRLQQEKENLALKEKQAAEAEIEKRQLRAEHKLPPGVLTPLLTRHRDLDDQLQARLAELEEK
jgi:kinesin family protein 22